MATPPPRGVGITCTSRSLGAAIIRNRMATIRTTGVVRKVTSAAVRRTTAYSRTDSAAALRLVPRRLRVCRVSGNQLPDAGGDLGDAAAFGVADGGADEGRDLLHVGLGHALGRDRGASRPGFRRQGSGVPVQRGSVFFGAECGRRPAGLGV